MKTVEAEGRTLEAAVVKALKELGLRREQVKIEVLAEPKGGFFGFLGSRMAKVRVIPLQDDVLENAKTILFTILERMQIQGRIVTSWKDHLIFLEIKSSDGGLLIGRGGRTLEALQYLINRILNSRLREGERIVVDVEGYRKRREEELQALSLRLAAKAKATGEAIALAPLSPYYRRIVHIVLRGDRKVRTASKGNGFYRRIVISPSGSG